MTTISGMIFHILVQFVSFGPSVWTTSTAITVGSKKSRSRPKNDIIKRNIQLAGTGDYLTPDERLPVEQILATIDEIESEESKSGSEKPGGNQLMKLDPEAARLSRIDN